MSSYYSDVAYHPSSENVSLQFRPTSLSTLNIWIQVLAALKLSGAGPCGLDGVGHTISFRSSLMQDPPHATWLRHEANGREENHDDNVDEAEESFFRPFHLIRSRNTVFTTFI